MISKITSYWSGLICSPYCWWFRNPATVDMVNIPSFTTGFIHPRWFSRQNFSTINSSSIHHFPQQSWTKGMSFSDCSAVALLNYQRLTNTKVGSRLGWKRWKNVNHNPPPNPGPPPTKTAPMFLISLCQLLAKSPNMTKYRFGVTCWGYEPISIMMVQTSRRHLIFSISTGAGFLNHQQ